MYEDAVSSLGKGEQGLDSFEWLLVHPPFKESVQDFPDSLVVNTLYFQCRNWVQRLVGELRSYMPWDMAKTNL